MKLHTHLYGVASTLLIPEGATAAGLNEVCPEGIVECIEGMAYDGDISLGRTCQEECNGDCCHNHGTYDHQSCGFFTGKVCKDGSCVGMSACWEAGNGGTLQGLISGPSCTGIAACRNLVPWTQSTMGDITNSCNGNGANAVCYRLGTGNYHIGSVTGSCNNVHEVCKDSGGPILSINNCCNTGSQNTCKDIRDGLRDWPEACAGTNAPTLAPTLSPTVPGPLTLVYDKIEANFTAGATNELEVGFVVGAGRNVTVEVLKTCDKGAEPVPPSLYTEDASNMVSPDPTEGNLTHSKIIVGYNFNKAEMMNSSLWNSTSETLTFCQVTNLRVPDQIGGGSFVILQDKREIEVKFDLDANFEVDVDLGDRTISNETEYIDFDDDVEAYKCRGGSSNSFSVDDGALPPNTELAICIRVQNNTSVIIDRLASMVIAQDENPSPRIPMVFVNDGTPVLGGGLTKISEASEGVIVKTRLPQGPDYFQFENGLSLIISGTVDLRLATGRKLRALAGENSVAGEEREVADINVVVGLQSTADGFGPIGSSGGQAIVGKSLAAPGLMVLAGIGIVMM